MMVKKRLEMFSLKPGLSVRYLAVFFFTFLQLDNCRVFLTEDCLILRGYLRKENAHHCT